MNGRYLLDTNIVIALFAHESAVVERLAEAEAVLVPSVVLGELYYGARRSARADENIARIDGLVTTIPILGCDLRVARRYGQVKDELRRKGTPIPENDIWIAAIALEHDLTLVTRDEHLRHIEALPLAGW